jgi:hypothetical protein
LFREKYTLGVDRKHAFESGDEHWSSTSLAIAAIVRFEYQYWFKSSTSFVVERNRFFFSFSPSPSAPNAEGSAKTISRDVHATARAKRESV